MQTRTSRLLPVALLFVVSAHLLLLAGELGSDAAMTIPAPQTPPILGGQAGAEPFVPATNDPTSSSPPAVRGASGFEYYVTGSPADVTTPTRPGLVLMGGGTDVDECFRWMIERSGGGDFLVLRTSGTDAYDPYIYEMTTHAGTKANSVATLIIHSRQAAADPFVLAAIAHAEALWIAGGDQAKHVRHWQGTPLLAAIEAAVARGVPLGGTSAGLDVLGQFIYSSENEPDPLAQDFGSAEALANPFHPRITLVRDLLSLPHLGGVLLESHFVQHDRMGRLVAFLARILDNGWASEAHGIGIQSRTALVVEPDGLATVVCRPDAIAPAAYFLRLSKESTVCRAGQPLAARRVSADQVRPGETFSLRTWTGPRMVSFALAASGGVLQSSHETRAVYP